MRREALQYGQYGARECWSYRFQPSLVNWVANVVTYLGVLTLAVTAAQLPGTPARLSGSNPLAGRDAAAPVTLSSGTPDAGSLLPLPRR